MNRAATLRAADAAVQSQSRRRCAARDEASGFQELDAALPNGGWQSGTIVELMPAEIGIGELRLLMPALARITHSDRHVALVSPPYIPFAPALSNHGVRLERLLVIRAEKNMDMLWAMEQTLRCNSFGAVVGWPESIRDRDVRRPQLAAEAGRSTGFLYRSPAAAREASPAAMRLQVAGESAGNTDRRFEMPWGTWRFFGHGELPVIGGRNLLRGTVTDKDLPHLVVPFIPLPCHAGQGQGGDFPVDLPITPAAVEDRLRSSLAHSLTASGQPLPMLWLCISLPQLPLEALHPEKSESPVVITACEGSTRWILCCNAAAERANLQTPMNYTVALGFILASKC